MNASLNRDVKLLTRIRTLAYEIWEEEGRPEGRALEHWLEAEREILDEERPLRHI